MNKRLKQLTISEIILESNHTQEALKDMFNENDVQKLFILNRIKEGNLEFLKELHAAGYDFNIHQNTGIFKCAMNQALHSNDVRIVQFLHENKVPLDCETLENAFWYKCKLDVILYIRGQLNISKPEYYINLCKEFTPQHLEEYVKIYES